MRHQLIDVCGRSESNADDFNSLSSDLFIVLDAGEHELIALSLFKDLAGLFSPIHQKRTHRIKKVLQLLLLNIFVCYFGGTFPYLSHQFVESFHREYKFGAERVVA